MIGDSLGNSASSMEMLEAVSSLQSSNAETIAAQRKYQRFDIRLKIVMQPADSIDRLDERWLGECHDISAGGCRILTRRPLQIGSVYWVQFEPSKTSIDPLFARCVRGHLLRENAFEFGMSFLTPVDLPDVDPQSSSGTVVF